MKCTAIRHLRFEDLGIFEEVLVQHGFQITYLEAGIDDLNASDVQAADLVVILGGPIGVYETTDYPWLTPEIEAIGQRLQQNRPTLGICLGAQIMAAALGAAVYPGPAKEVGWSRLDLTPAAHATGLRWLENVDVLHWHGDTFDLPQGATWLASTALTPHQAFSMGPSALALQFHAEAHGARMEPWLIGHTLELRSAGIDIPGLRSQGLVAVDAKAQAGKAMLQQWLAQVTWV